MMLTRFIFRGVFGQYRVAAYADDKIRGSAAERALGCKCHLSSSNTGRTSASAVIRKGCIEKKD
jgi:hypothetical protein